MRPIIYLDNSATTRVDSAVYEAMAPYQERTFGNASSLHWLGRRSREAVEHARTQVAQLLGATAPEIYFTPNATFSNNAAILGFAKHVESEGRGRHLITTPIEHSSALLPARHLEKQGWRVTYLTVNKEGLVDVEELRQAIRTDTTMISIMWANNEIGSVQPIQEIGKIARQHDIFFHCDAVQVPGKLPMNVAELYVDTLSISGHKFHGPKGIGALYVRAGVKLEPIVLGGGQEKGIAPGTESVANIVGIGKAAELAHVQLKETQELLRSCQNALMNSLLKYHDIVITGPTNLSDRLPGHVSIVVPGVVGSELVIDADINGVGVSSASACAAGSEHPSHVLAAIGLSHEDAIGSLRITAGAFNTPEECERAAEILNDLIGQATFTNANAYSVPA